MMNRLRVLAGVAALVSVVLMVGCGQMGAKVGTEPSLSVPDVTLITDGVGRAITWENQTGEPGAGGKAASNLGPGRKGAACIRDIKPGAILTLMDADGPGVIRHMWITIPDRSPMMLRNLIVRMYWDHEETPSVEVPLGDFFGTAHGRVACDDQGKPVHMVSAWTTVTLGRGFNCYFPLPFDSHAKITVENDTERGIQMFFFQIDYERVPSLPANSGRFHAQFRRQNPTIEKQDYVIVDHVRGPGVYVGTVLGVRALGPYWWGEGEVKFCMDGDTEFPTICGTGAEDYICAAWGMHLFQTPYHGCTFQLKNEFFKEAIVSMYRWHVLDPVRFRKSLKVTVQQMGWVAEKDLFERSDDWCSTAFWYQHEPHNPFPTLPDRAARIAGLIEPDKAEQR